MDITAKPIWKEPEEITISLPCGVIAGKWWGPKNIRPILCLHGWQDNAGTFDRLIRLLPKHVSYLAIDYPGHGLSFHYPTGIVYNFHDFTFIIRLIADLYKWTKVSLLCHSMGVLSGFYYAGLYAEDVDLVIMLDVLQPQSILPEELCGMMRKDIDDYVKFNKNIITPGSEPPSYTINEIGRRIMKGSAIGSANSITIDTVPYLLKRGIAQSKLDPTKYYFTRDVRVRHGPNRISNNTFAKYLIKYMRMPFLYIKSKDSGSEKYEPRDAQAAVLDELKKCNPNFKFQLVDGQHHVHLTHPERVSGFISETILTARPLNSGAELINQNVQINCKL